MKKMLVSLLLVLLMALAVSCTLPDVVPPSEDPTATVEPTDNGGLTDGGSGEGTIVKW